MDYTRLDVPLYTEEQKTKECKKQTPDYIEPNPKKGVVQVGFRVKDTVIVDNAVSLVNKSVLNGEYVFDSYDNYDNTCYVTKYGTTFNILLTDLTLVPKNIKK